MVADKLVHLRAVGASSNSKGALKVEYEKNAGNGESEQVVVRELVGKPPAGQQRAIDDLDCDGDE